MKNRILHLATEFAMVFLGVLLAFFANDWSEKKRDEKYVQTIIENLVDDVRKDSANIIDAIEVVGNQYDSLTILLDDLYVMNHKKANNNIYCTYFCYNIFEPTTATYESMIFSGDMKLIGDPIRLKSLKNIDEMNQKLRVLHSRYQSNIESFRNTFISKYNIQHFNFGNVSPDNGIEFWNRLTFLSAHVKYYYEGLLIAQKKYNDFLTELRKDL